MMGRYVGDLSIDRIRRLSDEFGFNNVEMLEKFLIDFEILGHLLVEVPSCIIKGGLAVPFHGDISKLLRLSEDIDGVTPLSEDKIKSSMEKLKPLLARLGITLEPHTPENPERILPLLTYYCWYDSVFGTRSRVKIDLFYGVDTGSVSTMVVKNTSIFDVKLDFEFHVYDRMSLIGDKLTTLPRNTIGIEPGHRDVDIPKQVFDIAILLRGSRRVVVDDIRSAFVHAAIGQIGYSDDPALSIDGVWDDLFKSVDDMLVVDKQPKLPDQYKGLFSTFSHNMLGRSSYTPNRHVEDIMLIRVACMLLRDVQATAPSLNDVVPELIRLRNLDKGMEQGEIRDIVGRIRGIRKKWKRVNFMTPSQAYLYEVGLRVGIGTW